MTSDIIYATKKRPKLSKLLVKSCDRDENIKATAAAGGCINPVICIKNTDKDVAIDITAQFTNISI